MIELGLVDLISKKILENLEHKPMIFTALGRSVGGSFSTLYRRVQILLALGLITETRFGAPKKRVFTLTEKGRKTLTHLKELERLGVG